MVIPTLAFFGAVFVRLKWLNCPIAAYLLCALALLCEHQHESAIFRNCLCNASAIKPTKTPGTCIGRGRVVAMREAEVRDTLSTVIANLRKKDADCESMIATVGDLAEEVGRVAPPEEVGPRESHRQEQRREQPASSGT